MNEPIKPRESNVRLHVVASDDPPEVNGEVVDDDWTRDLPRKKDGCLKNTFAVLCAILRHDPKYKGTFWYDELWLEPRRGEKVLDDANDYNKLMEEVELQYGLGTIPESNMYRAVELVAKERSRHPVREYIDNLVWDGIPRLSTWFKTYLGAKGDDEYLGMVGSWTLQAAVDRAFNPGCQVDYVTVLEGEQGLHKSSLLLALVPNQDWVAAHQADIGTKDSAQVFDGKWILELDEFDRLSKFEHGQVKAFITRRNDHYRRTWAKKTRTYQRQVMLMATSNRDEYVYDPTGNRRIWPAKVTKIDVDAIIRDRDQLWAEARYRQKNGERRWPTREEEERLFAPEQEQRRQQDPREQIVCDWLNDPKQAGKNEFSVNEILLGALNFPLSSRDEKAAAMLGKIMAAPMLRWEKVRCRSLSSDDNRDTSGKKRRAYVYRRPVHEQPNPPDSDIWEEDRE